MKRLVRTTLSSLSHHALRLTNGSSHPGLRILTYHRVTDAHPGDRLCVPTDRFAQQMHALHEQGYRTATFGQAIRWVTGAEEVPRRSVVLTFDDGFEDNFLWAYPELARYGFSACFFVPSAFIESGGRQSYAPADRPMTWTQLQELLRDHQEVGAHSVSHRKLTLLNHEEMRWEVRACKQVLEQRLGRPIPFFCYPAGQHDDTIRRAVAACGYEGACSVRPGTNRPGEDPFALRRTEISAVDSLHDFEKKLSGAYDWLHEAAQWAARRRPLRECANAMPPLAKESIR